MTDINPESEYPTMSEHMDDAIAATNLLTLPGLASIAVGAIFESKALIEVGGVMAISGFALNGLAKCARAVVNLRRQIQQ